MTMRLYTCLFLAAVAVAASSGCKKESSSSSTHGNTAKPGSHEDWCEEHAVPESQCTKCNKSLIPAFKATGDWCDQHNLPKSQDRDCNPKLQIARRHGWS